ncbi:transposase [Microcystis aeruginosa]|uniref:Transposase IS4-like domain-containing protein n=1 Tax=Microcystis aeruginosa PCC 9443 TaxID=1160281 RepID=I4FZK6_MICAE|nr:hypothetical protein MICAC_1610004 [Microcystis aeruginosa PCC 9443]
MTERDEIITLGQYRSNPCHSTVRLVSVLWGNTWYDYLTNVLDSEQLSAEEVGDLYRRRWQIEEAFLLTKRLLVLVYLWIGHTNGVQIQILTTLIFWLFGLCYAMDGGYKGWTPYIERHLAIFVNCFCSRAN